MFTRLFLRGFFPGVLFGATGLCQYLISTGWAPSFVVFGSFIIAAMLILAVQKLHPFSPDYVGTPQDFGVDLLHMLLSTGVTAEITKAATLGGLTISAAYLSTLWGMSIWPSEWPWPFQLALALVVGDFGAYWVHRKAHESPLLWRVHAMHHSSEKLYVLASARNHPFNVILTYSSQVVPLILLGAPMEAIALLSVFTGVHGMLQHSNLALRYGIWNRIFATADLHRWHHSAEIEESNHNYGSNLILWDLVFGTWYLPEDRKMPQRAGLSDWHVPHTWWDHIKSPFTLGTHSTLASVPVPVGEEPPSNS